MGYLGAIRPADIDAQIEEVLGDVGTRRLPLVRKVIDDVPDRWYGQLLAESYATAVDEVESDDVLPAAVAIELLRGYVRLRSALLVQLSGKHAHSLSLTLESALLAGDFLHSSANSVLLSSPGSALEASIADVTESMLSITASFTDLNEPDPSASNQANYFDTVAGTLGKTAASIGASIAGVNENARQLFADLGRGLGTSREIQRFVTADSRQVTVVPPVTHGPELRQHGRKRREEAMDALWELADAQGITIQPFISLAGDPIGPEESYLP